MTDLDHRRQSAPAALRNRDPILDVLRSILPAAGLVLEVASGTGEHAVHFARHLPGLDWQPSDPSPAARHSIAAWIATEGLANIHSPVDLDAARSPWPIPQAAAIVCINMVHISPWEATLGLMQGAGEILPRGGLLYLYGPYLQRDRPLAVGNLAFDRDLRAQDPRWGLRESDDLVRCASERGLVCDQTIAMPANNLSLIFRKE